MTYVNLQLNPERYTGYVGPSARRIWEAIYTEKLSKMTGCHGSTKSMMFKAD
ncbi:hypothetical protein HPP92_027286 [Vanilla planifolia]|uniref:Uncharacterized protein n=1 Tax=Vanilla planifolia TaxID=51239 RepID=A0A835PC87_VANPL|nr:hypothetical protein HPP92_027286 [Vanilla planifolia]